MWGLEEPDHFPYKSRNCWEEATKPRIAAWAKDMFVARRTSMARAEEGEFQDLGDLDLCAVGEVWDSCVGQSGADTSNNLPPGLISPGSIGLWYVCMDPSSGRDPWADQFECGASRTSREADGGGQNGRRRFIQ